MSKIVYLVINLGDKWAPYKDQYQVFDDPDKALKHAIACGWQNPMGFNKTVGVMNAYKGGDIDVAIMPIEIK